MLQPFQLRLVGLYHLSLSNLQSYFRFSDTYWEALSNSTCLDLSFFICKNKIPLISKCYCANSAVTDTTKHSEQCLAHGIYNCINATVLQGTRQQHAFVIITSMSTQGKPLEASSGARRSKGVCKHLSLPFLLPYPFFPLHSLQLQQTTRGVCPWWVG